MQIINKIGRYVKKPLLDKRGGVPTWVIEVILALVVVAIIVEVVIHEFTGVASTSTTATSDLTNELKAVQSNTSVK